MVIILVSKSLSVLLLSLSIVFYEYFLQSTANFFVVVPILFVANSPFCYVMEDFLDEPFFIINIREAYNGVDSTLLFLVIMCRFWLLNSSYLMLAMMAAYRLTVVWRPASGEMVLWKETPRLE